MVTRHVFIVWSHPLFRDTMRLLLKHPSIEIVGMGSQQEDIMVEIEHHKPEIIIVEETDDDTVTRNEALQILQACPWEAKVIRLSLNDNELWLYHHERRSIDSANDLLSVVQNS